MGKEQGCTRTLTIVDDTGYTHGELDINIHSGTPCVCAIPRKEKIAVKDKVIQCPQKLSDKKPNTCGEKLPTPSSSISEDSSIAEVGEQTRVVVEKKYKKEAEELMHKGVEAARKSVNEKYGYSTRESRRSLRK